MLVSPGGRGDFRGLLDEQLEAMGTARTVALSVSQFLVAPMVAATSDAVVMLPSRLRRTLAGWGLVEIAAPVAMPSLRVSMLWREGNQNVASHRWLRQKIREVAAAT